MIQMFTFECARCSVTHNGQTAPAGWGFEPGQGHLCSDCQTALTQKFLPQRGRGTTRRVVEGSRTKAHSHAA